MKTLYESLLGDMDDIIDKATVQGFLDGLKGKSLNNTIDAVVNSDGSISCEYLGIYHTKIPKYIKFKNCENITLSDCEIEDIYETLNGGRNQYVDLKDCSSIGGTNRKLKNACSALRIDDCAIDNLDWVPNDITTLNLEEIDIDTIDLKGKKLKRFFLGSANVSSIINANVVWDSFHIANCPKLKKIDNIKAREVAFNGVGKLTDIKLSDGVELLRLDSSLKHLSPDIIPSTIEVLYAGSMGEEWVRDNIQTICPKLCRGEFPDPRNFKFKNNPVNVGDWVVIKGKAKNSGIFGSSRGALMVDKVIKVTDARIKGEKAGLRPFIDVEPMIDANPKKDWSYVDPNGINDITGVGIEVGDKVVAYLPSGYIGKNNGLVVDEILKLTKSGVKCKNAGNRRPYDICILRSQAECDKQFK